MVSYVFFLLPRRVDSLVAGPEEAKNLAGESPPPDLDPFSDAEVEELAPACQSNSPQARIGDSSSRNTVSFSSRTHNQTLSVAAMRVRNPDRSPVGINR